MIIIKHRINTLKALKETPTDLGIELDLRDFSERLVLQHDAFKDGELFEEYIPFFQHPFLILNVKCEGIEARILETINAHGIQNYFFLDLSFPALMKQIRNKNTRLAIRFSEFESLESCLLLKDKVDWVWVDCFNQFPLDLDTYTQLHRYFKLCLVSPELQSHPVEKIQTFKQHLTTMPMDAVCTKYPELWA